MNHPENFTIDRDNPGKRIDAAIKQHEDAVMGRLANPLSGFPAFDPHIDNHQGMDISERAARMFPDAQDSHDSIGGPSDADATARGAYTFRNGMRLGRLLAQKADCAVPLHIDFDIRKLSPEERFNVLVNGVLRYQMTSEVTAEIAAKSQPIVDPQSKHPTLAPLGVCTALYMVDVGMQVKELTKLRNKDKIEVRKIMRFQDDLEKHREDTMHSYIVRELGGTAARIIELYS